MKNEIIPGNKIPTKPDEDYHRQQREIAESLKYASYIQQAMLPVGSLISKYLPDHFIFYQPRDLVSGDFYYVSGQDDKIFLAVGDCTGHGVPGAFMSILGITFLNQILAQQSYTGASSVLNQMREHVMRALQQTGDDNEQKDGIDLTCCILDTRNNALDFAGAFSPLYIIRDYQLTEIQGDKMPVGIGAEEERSFTGHSFQLQDNDMLYLFSDGYIDQFGGADGKKFKYKPFRNLILSISDLSMEEQKSRLMHVFTGWKGNLRQLDDVLVFGCRYHTRV
ncbi:MAG TPA: SpoIIE family protein phosphatase [Bacteroidales bacterium]|nr:SpoIIE family protein phosphatase [Bacteroidales bacterium]